MESKKHSSKKLSYQPSLEITEMLNNSDKEDPGSAEKLDKEFLKSVLENVDSDDDPPPVAKNSDSLQTPPKHIENKPKENCEIRVLEKSKSVTAEKANLEQILKENEDDDDEMNNSRKFSSGNRIVSAKRKLSNPTPAIIQKSRSVSVSVSPVKKLDPLTIIDINENSALCKGVPSSHIQYLAESMQYVSVKVSRMIYTEYTEIGQKLENIENGRATCLKAYGNFLYVGTSMGVVRVFDFSGQDEHKPISLGDLIGTKITCIDISRNGLYMAVGFANGKIMVYDFIKGLFAHIIGETHERAVVNIKFLKGPKIWTISSDVCGCVFLTTFGKAVYGLAGNSSLLLNNRVGFGLAPLYENSLYENSSDSLNMVAIAGVNSVIITVLEPYPKVLWEIRRKLPIKKGIPYIDWGRAILPGKPSENNLVLAIAWDKIIQLISISNDQEGNPIYEFNGFYESESEIQSLWWVAESVLIILNSLNEIRILHSEKFASGEFSAQKTQIISKPILEDPYKINEEIIMQVYSVGKNKAQADEQQMKNSYHQAFSIINSQIAVLCKSKIIIGKLLSWNEYLDKHKSRSQWIDALRISLEIFQGTLKGFADLSENKELREAAMRAFMKNFIQEGLETHLEKFDVVSNTKANITQVQVTIEFCIAISAFDFLFNDLIMLFTEYGLEQIFFDSLEPYILQGSLNITPAPQDLVARLINFYTKRSKVDTLEKILLHLNLELIDLEFLSAVCISQKMYSALIYVKSLYPQVFHYMEPCIYMHNEMLTLKSVRKNSDPNIPKAELHIDPKSYAYLGYKILWYIRKCFKGERFPERQDSYRIPMKSWPSVVYILIKWMFMEHDSRITNLQDLIELDVKCTFDVLSLLFKEPYLREFMTNVQAYSDNECPGLRYSDLLQNLYIASNKANSPTIPAIYYFYIFTANVASQPSNSMSPDTCTATAIFLMKYHKFPNLTIEKNEIESLVLGMIKNCKDLNAAQINSMNDEAKKGLFTELEVYLAELKGDYFRCFEIYFNQQNEEKAIKIFEWLDRIKENVKENSGEYTQIIKLIGDLIEKMVFL